MTKKGAKHKNPLPRPNESLPNPQNPTNIKNHPQYTIEPNESYGMPCLQTKMKIQNLKFTSIFFISHQLALTFTSTIILILRTC